MIKQHRRSLGGRQKFWILYDSVRFTETDEALAEIQDLAALRLQGDKISKFLDDWTVCLMNQKEPPAERMLESLFRTQLEHSRQFEL